jgi:hypothetical protein
VDGHQAGVMKLVQLQHDCSSQKKNQCSDCLLGHMYWYKMYCLCPDCLLLRVSVLPLCCHTCVTPSGHKLQEFTMDESSVLKGISKVYGAKKAAALALLAQEDKAAVGQGGGKQRSKK